MEEIIVCKYGGSSVTGMADLKRIRDITAADKRRRVVVVSAPGRITPRDEKVTDMLLKLAKTKDRNIINKILERYGYFRQEKSFEEIKTGLEARVSADFADLDREAYRDSLAAFGEEACAKTVSESLGYVYVDAKDLFEVISTFGNARILPESDELIRNNLLKRLESSKDVFVIPGFYGADDVGRIVTFSRGGSNLTATYIAAAINAVLVENFTDTDGVYAADPNIVDNPRKIDKLTFNEMRDLSYSGFGIMHPSAVIPLESAGIPMHIRNTFKPEEEGTYVVAERVSDLDKPVVGVAYRGGFCSLDVAELGLNDEIGILASLTDIFRRRDISVEYTPGGVDDQSLVFHSRDLDGVDPVGSLKKEICDLTGSNPGFRDNLGSIVVAGKGLRREINDVDLEIRALFKANHIGVEFGTQGHLRRCLIYGVDARDGKKAVNLVYDRFLR